MDIGCCLQNSLSSRRGSSPLDVMPANRSSSPGVAVVTGAAVRLGRAIALALAEEGYDLVVHYGHSRDEVEQTAKEIGQLGRNVATVAADLMQPAAAANAIFDTAARLGGARLLVNSAAIFENASLCETSEELYDRHLAINLKAPFFLSREFVRRLPGEQHGQIINLADWRAETPPADYLAYTLSKAGIVALTKALALQLAPRIRVNAIAPGAMLPPPGEPEEPWRMSKLPEIPLARTGSPDDIAAAAVYLARSEFVTGEILHVTGGEHL
jgi:pteridine reductase